MVSSEEKILKCILGNILYTQKSPNRIDYSICITLSSGWFKAKNISPDEAMLFLDHLEHVFELKHYVFKCEYGDYLDTIYITIIYG